MIYRIKSTTEFLNVIYSLHKENNFDKYNLYYRGEPSSRYSNRTPNLYRDSNLTLRGSEVYYRNLMNELGRDSYPDGASLFQILAEMQHYEAKTRILDITKNPLVALYFAVEQDQGRRDGAIYIYHTHKGDEKFDSGSTVGVLAALNFIDPRATRSFLLYMRGIKEFLARNGLGDERINLLGKVTQGKHSQLTTEEIFDFLRSRIGKSTILSRTPSGLYTLLGVRNTKMTEKVKRELSENSFKEPHTTVENMMLRELEMFIKSFLERVTKLTKSIVNYNKPLAIYRDISKSHIILTSKKTDRIRQQQGSFIYPAYPTRKLEKNNFPAIQQDISKSINELSLKISDNDVIFIIPKHQKKNIVKELSRIGIDQGFIYPDIKGRSDSLLL